MLLGMQGFNFGPNLITFALASPQFCLNLINFTQKNLLGSLLIDAPCN